MHLSLLLTTSLSTLLLHSAPTLADNDSTTASHQRPQTMPKLIEETGPVLMKKKAGLPIIEKLDPFVVNLSDDAGFLLHVDIQTELTGEEARKRFTYYMPKIRSGLILLLSSKTVAELDTADGKEQLQARVKQFINELMEADEEQQVESVLFTSFAILQHPQ